MGWSCAANAAYTLDLIAEQCVLQTGSSNQFQDRGSTYFFERGRENEDGAVTGSVYRMDGEFARRSGNFRIEPDGQISRGPAFMKRVRPLFLLIDGKPHGAWFAKFGTPNEDNLFKQVKLYADSFKIGGINQHVSKSLGYLPYPTFASVVDTDGKSVVEWKAGMFQVWE